MEVPGTVHLVDMGHGLNVQKNGEIILQPQPLDNVNDPLRWSQLKKNAQFSLLFVWSFFLAVTTNWTAPYWTEWTTTFNCLYTQLNISTAICFIFLGFGCLFLQPTAMKLGRRCVYLVCSVLALVANAIAVDARNILYIYASNALAGFAAAPVDSLVEISSTDVFFAHERATKLAWLILALYFGSDVGPVVAGYLPNWQWAFKLQAIIFGALIVIQLFLMEDTTFARADPHTEEEIRQQLEGKEPHEKKEALVEAVSVRSTVGTRRLYWKRMQLLELEFNDKRLWLTIFYRPFFMACLPAIVWGGVVYGSQMMWLLLLGTTQLEIYTPYYNFSQQAVGLTNLAAFGGSVLGMFYGGMFVDWLTIWLSKRNDGVLEPEFRLYSMWLPTLANAGGLLAYGLAPVNREPWAVSVIVGQGLLGFAMTSTGSVSLTYAIECYPKLASEGLVLMLFLRNMVGCAFAFAIQPWLDRDGLVTTTWLMFMLAVVVNGSCLVLIFWGKDFRRRTAAYYEKISDPNFGAWRW